MDHSHEVVAAADARELPINQVSAYLAAQLQEAEIPHVFQQEHAQHHLCGRSRSASRLAFVEAQSQLLLNQAEQDIVFQYLVRQRYRFAGVGTRVPHGALVHALRHSLATRLAEDGATASEIQHLLGHESLTTSQGYIDATAREQRDAARANRTYRTLERILANNSPPPDRTVATTSR